MNEEIAKFLRRTAKQSFEARYQQDCDRLHELLETCGSPIEQRLLIGMYYMPMPWGRAALNGEPNTIDFYRAGARVAMETGLEHFGEGIAICPQQEIHEAGGFRCDFLLLGRFKMGAGQPPLDIRIVIECDGHDFHERTKEQAMRDRARDRDLQNAGFVILRFTGAEIYRKLDACLEEIASHIERFAIESSRAGDI